MEGSGVKVDTIYCGDACELLEQWAPGKVDLAFADPPYNIGYIYDKYQDDLPDQQYVAWCRRWMAGCQRVLKADGAFYIAIGDDFAADLRIVGRELGLHLRNWIIWHYTFGQNTRAKFARAHTHILYFTKHPDRFVFNDRLLRYPSARHTEYQDLRASPLGRLPDDVWDDFPRVCGTFRERAGFHGCQLPEALLTRIILASSNPGDVVLDPLLGSGTTAVVAKRLGRKYVGIDISEEYVGHARERLKQVRDESRAQPQGHRWPELHEDMLAQLYRETKVSAANLLPNEVALRVIAASLSARTGAQYDAGQVRERLQLLADKNKLPKLPNDTAFVARSHVKSEGKRYVRQVKRWEGRRGKAEESRGGARNAI
ncbi:MAG: site-specific DNA-methyltransferase [Planctomycetes bacterium]|nr:site-specific DNA-methyltransferase [Planctomycetota bacterium]